MKNMAFFKIHFIQVHLKHQKKYIISKSREPNQSAISLTNFISVNNECSYDREGVTYAQLYVRSNIFYCSPHTRFSRIIPLMFFNKHSFYENIPTLVSHLNYVLRWLTLEAGVIKVKWDNFFHTIMA